MRKELLCLLTVGFIISHNSYVCIAAENNKVAEEETEIKFREYDWETSYDTILNKETDGLDSNEYVLIDDNGESVIVILNQRVGGLSADTCYDFDEDRRLYFGMYIINEEHSNPTQYYYDYCNLVEKYTKKYGEPTDVNERWYDDLYKDDPSDWGMAIITGDVIFSTWWTDKDDNSICILLNGDNYEASFTVNYQSGSYEYGGDMGGI